MADTVKGWVADSPDFATLTVAGLIDELRAHVAIDPTRADDPVVVWLGGKSARERYVLSVAGHTGNDDPEIGGHRQVFLLAHRATGRPTA